MEPQPAPNAPAPPPLDTAERSRKRYARIWFYGGVCCFLLAIGGLTDFSGLNTAAYRAAKAERVKVITQLREVHRGLMEFDAEYGSFPNASTIPAVSRDTKTTIPLGTSSANDFLRQLLACGLADENVFHVNSKRIFKPDGRMTGAEALKRGECGFAYVVDLSTGDDSSAPLLIAPVIPGLNRFDPVPFSKKVVILFVDGSAMTRTIRMDGKIAMGNGVVLDPSSPEWNGKPITIAWPE